ncbi:MAG: hypothetical protein OXP09_01800 [Gammaproteobacteria bacterium]|nr:hypothetical protein [Gammaproteobacteria bacterium]
MTVLENLVKKIGYEKSLEILERHIAYEQRSHRVLTIVVNRGVHHIPKDYVYGEVYFASEGNLDFSSETSTLSEFENILISVARKLKSTNWEKIYLVPFGPNTLCMQIKLMVYRITRIETVDLFYRGEGKYFPLEIDQRGIITKVA